MILELKSIYKTYYKDKLEIPVLKDISLQVEEGEYIAIMGPSGSGKSTLMNIIGCLDKPTEGSYVFENMDILKLKDKELSEIRLRSIGFVFQNFNLLQKQSALENVALPLLYSGVPKSRRLKIAETALQKVGLEDRMEFKPNQMSGGQNQRVAIARAVVNDPKIILADEPTGALDSKSGEQIMNIFRRLNDDGTTIIMITHEREIAEHADRIVMLHDGRINYGTGESGDIG